MRRPHDPIAAAEFARRQIDTAHQILAGHLSAGRELCMCGKTLPCSVAFTCSEVQRNYQRQLAGFEVPLADTVPLVPVTEEGSAAAPRHRRRRFRLFDHRWPIRSCWHSSTGQARTAP